MCTKFGTAVEVADVITSDKFFGDRLRHVDSVEVENRHLPLTKPVAVNTGLALPRSPSCSRTWQTWSACQGYSGVLLCQKMHLMLRNRYAKDIGGISIGQFITNHRRGSFCDFDMRRLRRTLTYLLTYMGIGGLMLDGREAYRA